MECCMVEKELFKKESPMKQEIAKGRILRILSYNLITLPGQINISIKDQHGDTECDAFGATIPEALADCLAKGWAIGYDKKPKVHRKSLNRRVRHMRVDKFTPSGWALREMWCVVEREPDGRYSLAVKVLEGGVSELTIYAKSVEQLHKDIYALGYEFFVGITFKNSEDLHIWHTLIL